MLGLFVSVFISVLPLSPGICYTVFDFLFQCVVYYPILRHFPCFHLTAYPVFI